MLKSNLQNMQGKKLICRSSKRYRQLNISVLRLSLVYFCWLFWVSRPFETVLLSILGRLPKRGTKKSEKDR